MLALISGQGSLPSLVADAQATRPHICVLDGFAPEGLQADVTFRLEHLGSLIADLRAHGVTEVCFCGAIARLPLDASELDAVTQPLLPIMTQAMVAGDDSALRAVMGLFESQGFAIRAAHELAPELVAQGGVLSAEEPDKQMHKDAKRALAVLSALAPLDVGQACVVGAGQVWGIETVGGTDHMLASLPERAGRSRAVMLKAPKVGQDLRSDMPAVGPATVEAVARAGLAGLVVQAGDVLLLHREKTIAAADAAGIVLWSHAAD